MASRTVTIEVQPKRYEQRIAGLGDCVFRGVTVGLDQRLRPQYRRPGRVNHYRFCNELISSCLVKPLLSPAQVGRLPERRRARLRTAVAESCGVTRNVRRLRGSHLSGDERLFAALLWKHEADMEQLRQTIAEFGARFTKLVQVPTGQWSAITRLQNIVSASELKPGGLLRAAGLAPEVNSLLARQRSLLPKFETPPVVKRALAQVSPTIDQRTARLIRDLQGSVLPDVSGLRAKLLGPGRSYADILPRIEPPRIPVPTLPNFGRVIEQVRRLQEEWADVTQFLRRWETSAYWFLLSVLGIGTARLLSTLSDEEFEEALLYGIEGAVADQDFIDALRQGVREAPFLTPAQRHHLDHGLEHAHERDWLSACPPLLNGLEGAFWSAAKGLQVITEQRALPERPTKSVGAVEGLFKLLPVEGRYRTFLVHRVFGGEGNPFRHGDAAQGERRQVLFGVAALVGWLDQFTEHPYRDAFGDHMEPHLVGAPQLALPPGTA